MWRSATNRSMYGKHWNDDVNVLRLGKQAQCKRRLAGEWGQSCSGTVQGNRAKPLHFTQQEARQGNLFGVLRAAFFSWANWHCTVTATYVKEILYFRFHTGLWQWPPGLNSCFCCSIHPPKLLHMWIFSLFMNFDGRCVHKWQEGHWPSAVFDHFLITIDVL